MELVVEKQRLTGINIKHHSPEIQEYYNSATSETEKDNRSNAIKLFEIGVGNFEDLPMIEATMGRIIGEFGRVGKDSYKLVDIPYQNPLEAAYAYFVDNFDHFYIRTKLAYTDGIEKYELHRREQHYTSSSVFWLLTYDHDDVHKPYYVVQYHNSLEGYIERVSYKNKEVLRKTYGLSKKQLEQALESGVFDFKGIEAQLKVVQSSIEDSIEEHLNIVKRQLTAQINFFKQSDDEDEKSSLLDGITNTLLDISIYERLLEEDRAYDEKVKHLKGQSAIDLWNKKAEELRENYQSIQ